MDEDYCNRDDRHLHTRPRHSASKSHMARKLRNVPPADIAEDMRSQRHAVIDDMRSSVNEHSHVNDLIADYNTIVSEILEKHAPLQKITIKGESCKPWYDETSHEARRKRRQLERKAKMFRLEIHRQMFAEQCVASPGTRARCCLGGFWARLRSPTTLSPVRPFPRHTLSKSRDRHAPRVRLLQES